MKIYIHLALLLCAMSPMAWADPEAAPAVPGAQTGSSSAVVPGVAPGAPGSQSGTGLPFSGTSTGSALAAESMKVVDWAATRTQDLLSTALASIGVKYRRGASDPSVGFDCSGFVRHVYKEAMGLLLPHNAYSMSLQGKPVAMADLQPGDLVFFNTLKKQFSHVGIYLGDDRFIHAPSHGKSVEVDKLSDSYWTRHFNGARRIDTEAAAAAPAAQP